LFATVASGIWFRQLDASGTFPAKHQPQPIVVTLLMP